MMVEGCGKEQGLIWRWRREGKVRRCCAQTAPIIPKCEMNSPPTVLAHKRLCARLCAGLSCEPPVVPVVPAAPVAISNLFVLRLHLEVSPVAPHPQSVLVCHWWTRAESSKSTNVISVEELRRCQRQAPKLLDRDDVGQERPVLDLTLYTLFASPG